MYFFSIKIKFKLVIRVSEVDKRRIINAFEMDQDYYLLGNQLGLKRRTVRGIIYRFRKTGEISTGHIGGHKKCLIKEDAATKILDYIEENPEATLKEMQQYLIASVGVSCSTSTIARFLDGRFYTVKKVRNIVEQRNSDRVKEIRSQYVHQFLKKAISSKECIYVDEMGFNLWTRKTTGRSRKGTRIYATVPSNRGRNQSLIMAISKKGPVHYKVVSGSVNREVYQTFISELIAKLPERKHYIIHDNASIHLGITTPNHVEIIQLPPYSPFLNPIEAVFSKVKQSVRKSVTRTAFSDISQHQKVECLVNLITTEVAKEEYSNLSKYFKHIKTFFPESLLKEDILD